MKDRIFTKKFFTAPMVTDEATVASQKSAALTQRYHQPPVYIASQGELPAPEQAKIDCNNFQLDPNYTVLCQQLQTIIDDIKQWCHNNQLENAQKWDRLIEGLTRPSHYLFSGLAMFQWFSEGKSALEGIFFYSK